MMGTIFSCAVPSTRGAMVPRYSRSTAEVRLDGEVDSPGPRRAGRRGPEVIRYVGWNGKDGLAKAHDEEGEVDDLLDEQRTPSIRFVPRPAEGGP